MGILGVWLVGVVIGGNNAGIHDAVGYLLMNNTIRLPAKRLMMLKDNAIRVWTGIDLKIDLLGPVSLIVAPRL